MKKNKKLFAILTLVAFMMTLVPAFAFAAGTAGSSFEVSGPAVQADGKIKVEVTSATDGNLIDVFTVADGKLVATTVAQATVSSNSATLEFPVGTQAGKYYAISANGTAYTAGEALPTGDNVKEITISAEDVNKAKKATAAGTVMYVNENSLKQGESTTLTIEFDGGTSDQHLFVWAEKDGSAIDGVDFGMGATHKEITLDGTSTRETQKVTFNTTGDITIKAAFAANLDAAQDGKGFAVSSKDTKVVVKSKNNNADVTIKNEGVTGSQSVSGTGTSADPYTGINANNGVDYYTLKIKLEKGSDRVSGTEVTFEGDKTGLNLSANTKTTNGAGIAEVKVSASKAGTYKVTVDTDNSVEAQEIYFKFGTASVGSLSVVEGLENTVAINNNSTIKLQAKDANGNVLSVDEAKANLGNFAAEYSKVPANSDLEEEEIAIKTDSEKIYITVRPDVAGDYTVKIYNKNTGKAVYTDFTADKYGKTVDATISYDSEAYGLGSNVAAPTVKVIDENGVSKDASNPKFSYSGKGVTAFNSADGTFKVSTDDKFIGEKITVTVLADKKIATQTLTIADSAAALEFDVATGESGKDAIVTVRSVDNTGAATVMGNEDVVNVEVTTVVTEKPEGAVVSVDTSNLEKTTEDNDFLKEGRDTIKISSNKEGQVKVNVIVDVEKDDGEHVFLAGVATVDFGEAKTPITTTVSLNIDSATMIVDGELVEIDAPAVIKDNRTFVPFRALSEAFGAQVEYDEATQTVTAVLDGKTVVLTIGSTVMTVNDEAVTIDVAPYIANSRTMVPVRAVAEAFGFDVEATFNADGSTAGVVFAR